ncbi:MAG: DUF302 domain-containing protein [Gammaproteobacteria bacterium]|nr:DUF302 domain-containing protein [Gammaproteobacteria bacterium]NNC98189.1 DUF302 domain-containing protein [Gammaproteobacteria bacterium]NNM14863.1 DUF302 domain-containing protein [Gammaproteobacteria bacterium]
MYYFASTSKSFEQALKDLTKNVKAHGYSILHVHDFAEIFKTKRVVFDAKDPGFQELCQVFEVCNASQARRVMENDMRLNMALPCRISVYTENRKVKVGMLSPQKLINQLSDNAVVKEIAREVDATLRQVIDETVR